MSKSFGVVGFLTLFVLVLISVVFISEGTPLEQKSKNQDNIRSQRVYSLSTIIGNYAYDNKRLPTSLAQLSNVAELVDPDTLKPFTYEVNSASDYSICAEFASRISKDDKSNYYSQMYNNNTTKTNPYVHERGITCFTYTIPPSTNN